MWNKKFDDDEIEVHRGHPLNYAFAMLVMTFKSIKGIISTEPINCYVKKNAVFETRFGTKTTDENWADTTRMLEQAGIKLTVIEESENETHKILKLMLEVK